MSDKPTITDALKLARKLGPEWDDLLARMESPKPWKHYWYTDHVDSSCELHACSKCHQHKRQRQACDLPASGCSIPDPVTEELPCIVARKMREIGSAATVFRHMLDIVKLPLKQWVVTTWFRLTPAQQLVCLWLAEGRLEK